MQYTKEKKTFDGNFAEIVIKLHKYVCITIFRLKQAEKHVI